MGSLLLNLYDELKAQRSPKKIKEALLKVLTDFKELKGKLQPLGFYMFNLGSLNDITNIRLHIWTELGIVQDELLMIHDHRFDILSHVICGGILNRTFHINKNGDSTGTIYEVTYNETGSILKKVGKGYDALLKSQNEVLPGEFYKVSANEFHESIPINQSFTATVIITETIPAKNAMVFGKEDIGDSITFDRREISKDIINDVITTLKKYL